MNSETEAAFRLHAESEFPMECCGLVAILKGREKYFACRNTMPDKVQYSDAASNLDAFSLHPEDYSDVEDQAEVIAVCHSHPNTSPKPTQTDLVSCEETKLVWHITRVDLVDGVPKSLDLTTTEPSGYKAPLVGRTFSHGVLDCYSIVRDWYKEERNIDLPNFKRDDGWWSDGHSDLYTKGFPEAGFEKIGNSIHDCTVEIGDVILMQIRSLNNIPNHAAVYIGDGNILHHLYGRLSSRDVFGGMWQDYTRSILRYKA